MAVLLHVLRRLVKPHMRALEGWPRTNKVSQVENVDLALYWDLRALGEHMLQGKLMIYRSGVDWREEACNSMDTYT